MPSRHTILHYVEAKEAADLAQLRLKEVSEQLIKEMEAEQVKTVTDNDFGKFTYVRRSVPVIDEKGLRRALTARVYDKFTVKKLDRKALEDAMGMGKIDPKVVVQYVQMKDGDPYIKYTETKDA